MYAYNLLREIYVIIHDIEKIICRQFAQWIEFNIAMILCKSSNFLKEAHAIFESFRFTILVLTEYWRIIKILTLEEVVKKLTNDSLDANEVVDIFENNV